MAAMLAIPDAPGALPLFGHSGALIHDPIRFLSSIANIGNLARVRFGPFETIAICEPELARSVFRNDRVFDKGGRLFDLIKEVTGHRAMVVMTHREHIHRRRMMQPAFHPTRFPGYAAAMLDQVEAVMASWRDGQCIELFREMQQVTARVGLVTMFTYMQPDWVLSRALQDSITVMDGLFRRIVAPSVVNRMPTPGNLRFKRANARLRTVVDRVLEEYRNHGVNCGDLLSAMLNEEGSTKITSTDVHDEVTVFLLAAMDTTAAALAWTMTELMRRPDIYARLRHEIETELGGKRASLDDLPKLKFMAQVVCESLRLHPPVWLLTRIVTEDIDLDGYPVKAGSTILLSPYIIHQRKEVFPDPQQFDPDRWSETRVTKQARNSLLPFGFGPRKCIGELFGLTEVSLALSRILPSWKLEPLPGAKVRSSASFVLRPHKSMARITKIR